MTAADLESLAIAIYGAMYEQYPQYRVSGPTPEAAFRNLSEEQRRMSRDQARAAIQHLKSRGWRQGK